MKQIFYETTLLFYDGPQIFTVKDVLGGNYIATAIPDNEYGAYAIAFGVRPDQLRLFKGGKVDLLTLINTRPRSENPLLIEFKGPLQDSLEVVHELLEPVPDSFLPLPGLKIEIVSESEVLQHAVETSSLTIAATLEPPEAIDHKIRVSTLSAFLGALQRTVRYAYQGLYRSRSVKEGWNPRGFELDFVSLSPGSVVLTMTTNQPPDLFGRGDAVPALELIQNILDQAESPASAAKMLYTHKGHFASAMKSLLDVLVDHDTRMVLEWAEGQSQTSRMSTITRKQAEDFMTELSQFKDIDGEIVEIEGTLNKIDEKHRTWRLISSGREVHGEIAEDAGNPLTRKATGIRYVFTCLEKLEFLPNGKERRKLYLQSVRVAGELGAQDSLDM